MQVENGDCEITKQSIDEIKVNTKYGDIVLKDCTIKDTRFQSNDGDLLLEKCKLEKIDEHSDYGSCHITNSKINESTFVLKDGDLSFKNTTAGKANITLKYGDLSVSESSVDALNAKLQDGECNIYTEDDINAYSINLFTNDGDLTLNGQKYGEEYHSDGSGEKSIDITNKYGDIKINSRK